MKMKLETERERERERERDAVCYYQDTHAQFQLISLCILGGSRTMFKMIKMGCYLRL